MDRVPSTIASWAIAIKNTLESYGVDSEEIFSVVNIDIQIIHKPNARIPVSKMTELWRCCLGVTHDATFGLSVADHAFPAMFHSLGMGCVMSKSLKDAVYRLVKYSEMVSDALTVGIIKKKCVTELHIANNFDVCPPAHESLDAFMAVIMLFPERFMGRKPAVKAVYMCRPQPEDLTRYQKVFGDAIYFNAPKNFIAFYHNEGRQPLPNYNAELVNLCEQNLRQYRVGSGSMSFEDKVYGEILKSVVNSSPTQESVAKALNMSVSSLQKRLGEDGKNYQYILDNCRKNVALEYLQNNQNSIQQIAHQLGFTSPSNFSRAFKRWQGMSPIAYRKWLLKSSEKVGEGQLITKH